MRKRHGLAVLATVVTVAIAGCGTEVAGTATVNTTGAMVAPSTEGSTRSGEPTISTSATASTAASGSDTESSSAPPTRSTDSSAEPSTPATSTGSPESPATSGGSSTGSAPVDPYPTAPRQLPEYPPTEGSAGALEGRRLATYTVVPTLYDETYSKGGGFSTLPLRGPSALGILFADETVSTVAERAGMMAGFSSSRTASNKDEMVIALLEFPSADAATKAVPLLAAAVKSKESDTGKVTVDQHPDAQGWIGTYKQTGTKYAHAFLAAGNVVSYVWVTTKGHSDGFLRGHLRRIYNAQLDKLKSFTGMAADQLTEQKLDPDGMLARTLPSAPANATVIDGVYSGAGMLHYMLNPAEDQPLFAKAGIDQVSTAGSTVYRTKDAGAAKTVVDTFVAETQQDDSSFKPMTAPDGADYVKCLQNSLAAEYYCTAQYGRYAVELRAETEKDMASAVSAQGKLLAGF